MQGFHRLSFIIVLVCMLSACLPGGSDTGWKSPQSRQQSANQNPKTLGLPPEEEREERAKETKGGIYVQGRTLNEENIIGDFSRGDIETEAPPSGFPQPPPVKVGILLPLSGPKAAIGQSMLQAAQLAVFDMGYENFELVSRDTEGTPQGAMKAAISAIDDGAQLILGPLFSSSVRAVKGITAQRNVNMISFSTDWTQAGGNSYVMGFLPFAQVDRITQYATAQGIRSVGIIAPQNQYGDTVTQVFEQKAISYQLRTPKKLRFPPQDVNITPRLKDFSNYQEDQEDDPDNRPPPPFDAVFVPVGGTQIEIIANALSYYHLHPHIVRRLGTGLWDDPKVAREPNMNGAWFAAPSPTLRAGFEQRYQDTYGDKPIRIASLAYDATALAAVLARSGYQQNGRPSFDKNSLTNSNGFAGIDGIFRFGQNGLVERGLAILEIQKGRIVEIDPAPKSFQAVRY